MVLPSVVALVAVLGMALSHNAAAQPVAPMIVRPGAAGSQKWCTIYSWRNTRGGRTHLGRTMLKTDDAPTGSDRCAPRDVGATIAEGESVIKYKSSLIQREQRRIRSQLLLSTLI
jgi:hypothetical protein